MSTIVESRSPQRPAFADLHRMVAIFTRDRRLAMSYTAMFAFSWLNIVVEVLVASLTSRLIQPSARFGWNGHIGTYFSYLVINFAVLGFQMVSLKTFAEAVRDGQTFGTLEVMLATPIKLSLLVLSSGLWSFLLTAIQMLVYIGVALIFGLNLSHLNVLTALAFLFLTIVSISPIGVIAASATMVFKKTGPVEFAMNSASVLLAGIYFPVLLLPPSVQRISWLLPLTHTLNGLRGAIYGASIVDLRYDAIWLCGFTALVMPIALWLFASAVRRSKLDGTLGLY